MNLYFAISILLLFILLIICLKRQDLFLFFDACDLPYRIEKTHFNIFILISDFVFFSKE